MKQPFKIFGIFCVCVLAFLFHCNRTVAVNNGGGSTTTDNAKVLGKAIYATGLPAKGASVRIRPEMYVRPIDSLEPDSVTRHDTTADDSGKYFIDSLKTGNYHIEINDNIAYALLLTCAITGAVDSIPIPTDTLRQYISITGKVDSASLGKAPLYVQVYGLDRLVRVDSVSGAYRIPDVPPGTYRLRIVSTDTAFKPIIIDTAKTDTTVPPPVTGGQWSRTSGPVGGIVHCLAVSPVGTVFAGTEAGGVFISKNNGAAWTAASNGITAMDIKTIAVIPNMSGGYGMWVGAGGSEGSYVSTNEGATWASINNGLLSGEGVNGFAASGNAVYVATLNGVFVSNDNGATWSAVSAGLPAGIITAIAASPNGTDLFVGFMGRGVFHSSDKGSTWSLSSNGFSGLLDTSINALAITSDGTAVFAGTQFQGVYRSLDNGATWTAANNGIPSASLSIYNLQFVGNILYAGANQGLFFSSDNGANWNGSKSVPGNISVLAFAAAPGGGATFFAGTAAGIFVSPDSGATWSMSNNGLTAEYVWAMAASGNNLYASTHAGVFLSTDNGDSWTGMMAGMNYGDL